MCKDTQNAYNTQNNINYSTYCKKVSKVRNVLYDVTIRSICRSPVIHEIRPGNLDSVDSFIETREADLPNRRE